MVQLQEPKLQSKDVKAIDAACVKTFQAACLVWQYGKIGLKAHYGRAGMAVVHTLPAQEDLQWGLLHVEAVANSRTRLLEVLAVCSRSELVVTVAL